MSFSVMEGEVGRRRRRAGMRSVAEYTFVNGRRIKSMTALHRALYREW